MLCVRHQLEQIHHVCEPHLDVGQVLAKQSSRRQGLHRRAVAATRHDDVWFDTLVVARPVPDPGAFCAVFDRRFDIEVLEVHLLVRDYDIGIVHALQTVVGDRQQAVGIRRQIDAHDVGALVCNHIEEARILMGEAVVVLTPDQRRDQ